MSVIAVDNPRMALARPTTVLVPDTTVAADGAAARARKAVAA
jgi:hypothetical protein